MKRYSKIKYITLTLIMIVSFFMGVLRADASTIYIDQPKGVVHVKDTVFVKVYIDTDNKEINAVEGTIKISSSGRIDAIETGGSILSVWPLFPKYTEREVSFVGGTPSGAFGNRLQLFALAVTPLEPGTVTLSVSGAMVYLADGKGTASIPQTKSVTFTALEVVGSPRNDVVTLRKQDTVPPEKFNAEYGQDPTVYGGKPFVTFSTTDTGSGVAQYEVIEDGVRTVTDMGVYVLHDEKNIRNLTITAIDSAGNKRSVVYNITTPRTIYPVILIVLLILVVSISYVFLKRRKKNVPTKI